MPEMSPALEQLESNYENRVPHHEKHKRDELPCRKNRAAGAQGEQVLLGTASWLKWNCERRFQIVNEAGGEEPGWESLQSTDVETELPLIHEGWKSKRLGSRARRTCVRCHLHAGCLRIPVSHRNSSPSRQLRG